MNLKLKAKIIEQFGTQADFGEAGSENEFCHVFLGALAGDARPNDHEIAGIRFVSAIDLERELAESPETITPWFKMEWQALTTRYRDQLAKYGVL